MKSDVVLLLAAFLAMAPSAARAVPLFLIAGQSNAAGQAPTSEISRAQVSQQAEVLYYRYDSDGRTGTLTNGKVPLSGTFGPEFEAANVLAHALSSDIALVKVAAGGTPLAMASGLDWDPASANELYDRLLANIRTAQNDLAGSGRSVELAAMFWMQGEQDAKSGNQAGGGAPLPQPVTASSYQENLTTLVVRLRTDLGTPNLPFFIGQINIGDDPNIVTTPDSSHNTAFGEWDYTETIQAAQLAVATADPNAYLVETSGLTHLSDYLHFDTAGQLALGDAFANSYLALVPEPATAVLLLFGLLAPLCRPAHARR